RDQPGGHAPVRARAPADRPPRCRLRGAHVPLARGAAAGAAGAGRPGAAAEAAGPLLESGATAVMCDDDVLAGGLYLAARERGIRIPEDISVVGFDDL